MEYQTNSRQLVGGGGNILGNRVPFGSPQVTLGKLLMTSLEQSSDVLRSDITSYPSPVPHNKCLVPALKTELIFQAAWKPDGIGVVWYFLFLTLFKGSQTVEEQMLYASFWNALTQRSKVERQLQLSANLNSLGQVVSKRDTLGCAEKPEHCHPGS